MNFYTKQHRYYCGVDLHAKQMYLCILDRDGNKRFHRSIKTEPKAFIAALAPFKDEIAVGVEGMFCWYWLADLCEQHGIPFVLGHAYYMRAVHGAKVKNDKADSEKIAMLLRSGMFPQAYVYPAGMRATRDLMRRRLFTVRKRAELLRHLTMTHQQYNATVPRKSFGYKTNRDGIEDTFVDLAVKRMIQSDSTMINAYTEEVVQLEHFIKQQAVKQHHNGLAISLLQTISGIGNILSLTMLYEIHDIKRFPTVQKFCSYARLVRPERSSDGKTTDGKNKKIGNQHLKWAFSEAAVLMIRNDEQAKKLYERLQRQNPKAKAIAIIAHRLGIAVYFMLQRQEAFDPVKFFNNRATNARSKNASLLEPGSAQDSRTASLTDAVELEAFF